MKCIVTGGAGFIGSHMVDKLVSDGDEVLVIDSLIAGKMKNIEKYIDNKKINFLKADLLADNWQDSCTGYDRVYHFAADPDVRQSAIDPAGQVRNTVLTTHQVLEMMKKHGVKEIMFTSTSTVYGEAKVIPTPESYTPMEPVSVYGASKLASEALISAYSHSFGFHAWVFRFANIIGQRSGHGVITDFIKKLRDNRNALEILGDGKQSKSYLDVSECIRAISFAMENSNETVNTFNIGSRDYITVTKIAEIVCEEMGLLDTKFQYTGGDRGWTGDIPKMLLSVDKLMALGWKPETSSYESVRRAVKAGLMSQ